MKNRRLLVIFLLVSIPLILLCLVIYTLAPKIAPALNNPIILVFIPIIIVGSFFLARAIERVVLTRSGQPEFANEQFATLSPRMVNIRAFYNILSYSILGVFLSYLFVFFAVIIGGYIFGEALRNQSGSFFFSLLQLVFGLGVFVALLIVPIYYIPNGAKTGFLNGGSIFPKLVPWVAASCYFFVPAMIIIILLVSGLKFQIEWWAILAIGITIFAGTIATFLRTKIIMAKK